MPRPVILPRYQSPIVPLMYQMFANQALQRGRQEFLRKQALEEAQRQAQMKGYQEIEGDPPLKPDLTIGGKGYKNPEPIDIGGGYKYFRGQVYREGKDKWTQLKPFKFGDKTYFPQMSPKGKIVFDSFGGKGGSGSGNLDKNKFAAALRKEMNATPEAKGYSEVRSRWMVMEKAWQEAQKTNNFVAVDQALITTFNKMTDPDSVVRESEYARTASDLEALNRLKGKWQKIMSGGAGLTQDDRRAIVRMGFNFMQAYEDRFGLRMDEYEGYMKEAGIDPGKHLRPFSSTELIKTKSPLKDIINEKETLPVRAASRLREGVETKFKNGQVWTKKNGIPVRVR